MPETIIATNRRARHDYTILESLEAGIELKGTEVKSLRSSRASLSDSFARFEGGELFLFNMHVSPYEFGNRFNTEPLRPRKLLLHKREIKRIAQDVATKGVSLVPLKLYFKDGLVKVELSVAKGKRQYDKRQAIRKRDTDKELRRALKSR